MSVKLYLFRAFSYVSGGRMAPSILQRPRVNHFLSEHVHAVMCIPFCDAEA